MAGSSSGSRAFAGFLGRALPEISVRVKPDSSATILGNYDTVRGMVRFTAWSSFEKLKHQVMARTNIAPDSLSKSKQDLIELANGRLVSAIGSANIVNGKVLREKDEEEKFSLLSETNLSLMNGTVMHTIVDLAALCENRDISVRTGAELQRSPSVEPLRPDFIFQSYSQDGSQDIASVEVKGPRRFLHLVEHGNKPAEVARFFNKAVRHEIPNTRYLSRGICQAVVYAAGTRSGRGAIYNHNSGLFFKVVPAFEGGLLRLNVHISKLYRRSESEAPETGVYALLIDSVTTQENISDFKVLEHVEEMKREEEPQASGDSSAGKAPRRSRGGRNPSTAGSSVGAYEAVDGEDYGFRYDGIRDTYFNRFDEADDKIFDIRLHYKRVIGEWSSGKLLEGKWDDARVVLKHWNWRTERGRECLLNEVNMYRYLNSRHRHIIGRVVPRLFAACSAPANDPVLVTEYVGNPIALGSSSKGNWVRGDGGEWVELTERQVEVIFDGVRRNLRELHECGVVHGDIHARNWQVERVSDKDGNEHWKVWLIDFGLAKFSRDSDDFAAEIEQVDNYFFVP